jgi:hypothetical protein
MAGKKIAKIGRPHLGTVQRAREALQAKAEMYVELHAKAAQKAAQRGNSNPAQWALEHISALDSDGKEIRVVSSGVDRQVIEGGNRAPTINIGWIGSPGGAKSSTERIIDVSPLALPEPIDPSSDS